MGRSLVAVLMLLLAACGASESADTDGAPTTSEPCPLFAEVEDLESGAFDDCQVPDREPDESTEAAREQACTELISGLARDSGLAELEADDGDPCSWSADRDSGGTVEVVVPAGYVVDEETLAGWSDSGMTDAYYGPDPVSDGEWCTLQEWEGDNSVLISADCGLPQEWVGPDEPAGG